jgi:hypothetical protein
MIIYIYHHIYVICKNISDIKIYHVYQLRKVESIVYTM